MLRTKYQHSQPVAELLSVEDGTRELLCVEDDTRELLSVEDGTKEPEVLLVVVTDGKLTSTISKVIIKNVQLY